MNKQTDSHKRILWVGEASFLNTGYANYGRELLKRLYASNKFEIAEFACYAGQTHISQYDKLPWRFYYNMPDSEQENQLYRTNPTHQFGSWRFEDVLIDFKPDYVLSITDPWMNSYQQLSPLRRFFRWIVMPTVDSEPLQDEWLATYENADALLAYAEFGKEVLEHNHLKVSGIASPCIDYQVFQEYDKTQCRNNLQIDPSAMILGTVMRNQKRKLFPDIIESFDALMDKRIAENKSSNIYLYCHTSYPDLGWDLPRMVRQSRYPQRILFTYVCKECHSVTAHTYTKSQCACPYCGNNSMIMPNTRMGVTEQQLAMIYSTMDCYVQYAICEGFGMPAVEAAACNVPVFAVDYSAMESVVKNLNGIPITPNRFFREAETHAYRCYPNNKLLVEKIDEFFTLPTNVRKSRYPSRDNCMKSYSWDDVANIWISVIENTQLPSNSWDENPQIFQPQPQSVNKDLPNSLFLSSIVQHVMGPLIKNKSVVHLLQRKLKYLNDGGIAVGSKNDMFSPASYLGTIPNLQPYNKDVCLKECTEMVENYNYWEQQRINHNRPPFLNNVKPDDKQL